MADAAPKQPLLAVAGLTRRFGALVANDGIDLAVEAGEVHAVIGPNGAGKTTLVAQLAGELQPDSGSVQFGGRDITRAPDHARAGLGLARSFQISNLIPGFTALENLVLAVQAQAGHSFRFWRPARRDPALLGPARGLLETVALADRANLPVTALSHGERRQLEVAMALAGQPRLLLLDEPMAGMGQEESTRMVALLRSLRGRVAVLLVEHDMDAVFALADRITVLVDGRVVASDAPLAVRASPAVRRAYLGETG